MAYNDAFWITVTSAAPVLALTHVVATAAANRFDHAVTDLRIWDSTRGGTQILLSILGFVASAVVFVWGMSSLLLQQDLGLLITPAILITLSFLVFLVLTILEM